MTDDEICELYEKELNTPYTPEELKFHQRDRRIKSLFEIMHAHNYELIYLVFDTKRYLFEGGPKPEGRLAILLRPGTNNDNAACARLRQIAKYFGQFEHGHTPLLPIVAYASRTSISLINFLEELFFHETISDLNHHAKEFFCLISYIGPAQMTREEFAKQLLKEADDFIDAMTIYSRALFKFIHEREVEMREGEKIPKIMVVKSEKPAKKGNGRGKHTTFMDAQLATFGKFLNTNPACASYSIIDRARQCWKLHQAEWNQAVKKKTGYASYKVIATAYGKLSSRSV